MAAAGMTGLVFRKSSGLQQVNILSDGSTLRLKRTDTCRIQLVQRTAADATYNNSVNMIPAKAGDRIACAMLMNLVAVDNRHNLIRGHIDNYKLRG
jgi:hypothetical protein